MYGLLIKTEGQIDFSLVRPKDPRKPDRKFILAEEMLTFSEEDCLLKIEGLDEAVMKWIGTNYSDYISSTRPLHEIKKGWLDNNSDEAKVNPDAWKELLKDDRWKEFFPPIDFDSQVEFFG